MISNTLKAIQSTKAKLASLEKKAAAEQSKQISNLHSEAGFETRAELIEALQALGGSKRRGRKATKKAKKAVKAPKAKKAAKKKVAKKVAKKAVKAPKPAKAAPKATGAKKRAKRTKITPALRNNIIAAVKAGGKGTAVAKKFGVSIPTLHNIKKAAGLTKARKK